MMDKVKGLTAEDLRVCEVMGMNPHTLIEAYGAEIACNSAPSSLEKMTPQAVNTAKRQLSVAIGPSIWIPLTAR